MFQRVLSRGQCLWMRYGMLLAIKPLTSIGMPSALSLEEYTQQQRFICWQIVLLVSFLGYKLAWIIAWLSFIHYLVIWCLSNYNNLFVGHLLVVLENSRHLVGYTVSIEFFGPEVRLHRKLKNALIILSFAHEFYRRECFEDINRILFSII